MYQSSSKSDGAVVGLVDKDAVQVCIEDSFESTAANEALVFYEENEEGETIEGIATASLDPTSGDIVWLKSQDKSSVERRTVCMSQM